MVVVNFNYRVGPYGFIASEQILHGGSTNNGLKDQRKALHWVQENISKVSSFLSIVAETLRVDMYTEFWNFLLYDCSLLVHRTNIPYSLAATQAT